MTTLQQLKKGISSTKSIEKITNAMQMVAASKLKKAQEAAEKADLMPRSYKTLSVIWVKQRLFTHT